MESSAKTEEKVFQSIREVIQIDKQKDWAQSNTLESPSLLWERGGETFIDGNTSTALIEEERGLSGRPRGMHTRL